MHLEMNDLWDPQWNIILVDSLYSFFSCLSQSNGNGRGKGQTVKLSKLNGLKKTEEEEDVREMITPALREALTKQGGAKKMFSF